MALLNSELVSKGVVEMVEKGAIRRLVDALSGAQKLGIGPLELFDGAAKEAFRRECCRIVKRGEVEELVDLMGILGGNFLFFIFLYSYFVISLLVSLVIFCSQGDNLHCTVCHDRCFVGSGFHFSIKELVEPAEIIKICVTKRKPNVAVRYELC